MENTKLEARERRRRASAAAPVGRVTSLLALRGLEDFMGGHTPPKE